MPLMGCFMRSLFLNGGRTEFPHIKSTNLNVLIKPWWNMERFNFVQVILGIGLIIPAIIRVIQNWGSDNPGNIVGLFLFWYVVPLIGMVVIWFVADLIFGNTTVNIILMLCFLIAIISYVVFQPKRF